MATVGTVNVRLTASDFMSAQINIASRNVQQLTQDLQALGVTSGPAFDALTVKLYQAQQQVTNLGTAASQGKTSLVGLGDAANSGGQQLSQMDSLATRLIERMILLYAIRAGATFLKDLFEGAKALETLSEETHMSTDKLQELQYGMEASGIPAGKLNTAIDTLGKNLGQMKVATADSLGELHMKFSDVFALSPDERFDAIAQAIGSIQSPLERSKLEIQLLGTDALDPLIVNYGKLKQAAHDTNSVMGEETVKQLSWTVDLYKQIGSSFTVMAGEFVVGAQNVVTAFAQPFWGGDWEKLATFVGLMATGSIADAIKAMHDLAVAPKGDISAANWGQNKSTDAPVMSQDYIQMLIKENQTVDNLTASQRVQLGVLHELDLLDMEHASHIDGMTTPAIKRVIDQYKEHDKAMKAAGVEADKFAAAWDDLNSTGEGWKGTLAGIDTETAKLAEDYLKAGASASAVAKGLELTQAQVKALQTDLANKNKEQAKEATITLQNEKVWEDYSVAVAALSGSTYDKQVALIWKNYDNHVAAAVKKGTADADFYNAEVALATVAQAKLDKTTQLADANSKTSYRQRLDDAQAEYDYKVSHADLYTQKDIALAKQRKDDARDEWQNWRDRADEALDATTKKMKEQTNEWKLSLGGSFTLSTLTETDVQSAYGSDQKAKDRLKYIEDYYKMYPGAAPGGSGPTGLNAGDSLGWANLLKMQQEYAQLKAFFPGFKDGISNFSGGLAFVHKDEALVNMAPGTSVIPAGKTGGMMGGGDTHVYHIYVNDTLANTARRIGSELINISKASRKYPGA